MQRTTFLTHIRLFCLLLLGVAGAFSTFATAQRRKASQQPERVYLIHADRLLHDDFEVMGAQRLSGKVHFRQGAMNLHCDSAVLFTEMNTFRAFGHVHMTQADTLSLRCARLFYDGNSQMAEARKGVILTHRKQVLLTDSLNYDRLNSLGFFFDHGKLIDGDNVLSAIDGEYSTATLNAVFNNDVLLTNKKFRLVTNNLTYNTGDKWAHVMGPSNVYSGENRIYTENGYYNTATQHARLLNRPQIFNQGRSLTGDSVSYDKGTGMMKAWKNVIFKDPKGKRILSGDYGQYDEIKGEALATDRALVKDYSSSKDTTYIHADTLRLYSYHLKTDSTYRILHAYRHVRAYRTDLQAVCDSLVFNSKINRLTLYQDPIVWNEKNQILGEEINLFSNDSTIDSVYVDRQALLVEHLDSVHFNQVAGQQMRSYFINGEMSSNHVLGNVMVVNYPLEKDSTIQYLNYTETTKMRMDMEKRKMTRLWTPAAEGTYYGLGMAPREHTYLPNFAWFDYIRPQNKDDIFNYRGKKAGTALKPTVRREAPLQTLGQNKTVSAAAETVEVQTRADGSVSAEKPTAVKKSAPKKTRKSSPTRRKR